MRPQRVTEPAERILSLEDAKAHLRFDGDAEDAYISDLILEAESYMDGRSGILGRCMVAQTWRYSFEALPSIIPLGMPDARSVAVTYLDEDGASQAVAQEDLTLREGAGGALLVYSGDGLTLSADEDYPVTVDIEFGYGAAADVPMGLVRAGKIHVQMGHSRGSMTPAEYRNCEKAFDAAIAPFRWQAV